MTAALDISRGQLTSAYLIATLLAAPSGLWLGRQLDHRNLATVIRAVGVGLAAALCIAAASPALWMLTIGILCLRLFGQTGFTLISSLHVARSINQRRGALLAGALVALRLVDGPATALVYAVHAGSRSRSRSPERKRRCSARSMARH